MTNLRPLPVLALVLIMLAAATPTHAQADAAASPTSLRDAVVVAVLAADSDSAIFADAAAGMLGSNLGSVGFRPVERYAGTLDSAMADDQAAAAVHREGGAR